MAPKSGSLKGNNQKENCPSHHTHVTTCPEWCRPQKTIAIPSPHQRPIASLGLWYL